MKPKGKGVKIKRGCEDALCFKEEWTIGERQSPDEKHWINRVANSDGITANLNQIWLTIPGELNAEHIQFQRSQWTKEISDIVWDWEGGEEARTGAGHCA